ncbi:hypothetical protein BDZ89DRAFT_1119160 [Hymenopellis radicata]|nr:hypothetical protein BDZ89DRAFT_1119160 [Hymenopellis radicata]
MSAPLTSEMPLPFASGMSPPHDTLGAFLIGFMISTPIYGITCLQATQYFTTYMQDPLLLKSAVAFVWLLETFDQCISSHAVYYYLILRAGDPLAATHLVWSLLVPAFTNGLAEMVIQFFFAKRVYIMSDNNRLLLALISCLAVAQFALATAVSIIGLRHSTVMTLPSYFDTLTAATFATVAAVDIVITSSLCYFLHIRKTGHARTNSVVNKIILVTINNGSTYMYTRARSCLGKSELAHLILKYSCRRSLNTRSSSRARLEAQEMSTIDIRRASRSRTRYTVDKETRDHASRTAIATSTEEDWYKIPPLSSDVSGLAL